jgi:proprotein convertase subtilisin/kexin type 5
VSNCSACLTSSTCSFCAVGYIVSADSRSCLFNCGILNCASCNSSTSCGTCNSGYTLLDSATSCRLLCSPGFFVNSTSLACQSCSSSVSFCRTCGLLASNTSLVICSRCVDLYYLNANGRCLLCSAAIANCLICLDSANCTSCSATYSLVYSTVTNSYSCIVPYSCNVSNCRQCLSSNSSICLECNGGYYLASSTSCALIQCLDTQYYDTSFSTCLCPFGSYLRNKKCHYCNLPNCISCNSAGCIYCKVKYFPEEGECKQCTSKCNNCTSATSCLDCETGYTLQSGICVFSSTGGSTVVSNANNVSTVVSCPPGC